MNWFRELNQLGLISAEDWGFDREDYTMDNTTECFLTEHIGDRRREER